MKQIIMLCFAVLALTSCDQISGSGNLITQTRTVGNFDGITVGGGFEVEVKIGPVVSVQVEADDNVIEYIKTSVSGNTLRIRTEDMNNYSDVHMKVYITVPAVNTIKASASADVEVMGILTSADKLNFNANSSASIKAEVNAPEVETGASSSGTINISGKTRSHKAEASSSGDINAFDLLSENAIARASSSASIQLHASVSLNAQASSSGSVEYKGAAAVQKSENSSGSVDKKD